MLRSGRGVVITVIKKGKAWRKVRPPVMSMGRDNQLQVRLIKVVYFDEETASDYLDISAGGKATSTSENVKDRTTKLHGDVEAKLKTVP